jgi:type IV secretory pathway TrbL component
MVGDMHQKISSKLVDHYRCVLLPSFQTKAMARDEQMVATDGAKVAASEEQQQAEQPPDVPPPPATAAAQADGMPTSNAQAIRRWKRERRRQRRVRQQRRIPSSTARTMLAQSHFKFKTLL